MRLSLPNSRVFSETFAGVGLKLDSSSSAMGSMVVFVFWSKLI